MSGRFFKWRLKPPAVSQPARLYGRAFATSRSVAGVILTVSVCFGVASVANGCLAADGRFCSVLGACCSSALGSPTAFISVCPTALLAGTSLGFHGTRSQRCIEAPARAAWEKVPLEVVPVMFAVLPARGSFFDSLKSDFCLSGNA